jgi:superfamily I DNA/RNA helicase
MAYFFRLPTFLEMTDAQKAVLDESLPVAITGGPGTGKSVVSIWRHIRNHDLGTKKSVMLTYTKTLQTYLSNCAAAIHKGSGDFVHRTKQWVGPQVDELIIDEAQDVSDAEFPVFKYLSKTISYGADDQQILYPDASTTQAELITLFPKNVPYELDQNFRNSYEVLEFTKAVLPNKIIAYNIVQQVKAERTTGIKPRSLVSKNDPDKEKKAVLDIIAEFRSESHNIGILLPTQDQVDKCYDFLIESEVACSKYFHDGEEIGQIDNVHVTTFKSAKGIEFDTVILPNFGSYKIFLRDLKIVEENDYYVVFTRTKRNLYLISKYPLKGINSTTYTQEYL